MQKKKELRNISISLEKFPKLLRPPMSKDEYNAPWRVSRKIFSLFLLNNILICIYSISFFYFCYWDTYFTELKANCKRHRVFCSSDFIFTINWFQPVSKIGLFKIHQSPRVLIHFQMLNCWKRPSLKVYDKKKKKIN